MQITAFKAILAQKINNLGAKIMKYFRTYGVWLHVKSISCTKQSNLFLHILSTSKRFSRRHRPAQVLVVFGRQ